MNWSHPNKVIIQGITDDRAIFCALHMKALGTDVVAGVSPGKGGTTVEGVPVFDLVEQVQTEIGEIELSLIFVDPYQVLDAAKEAIAAGIRQIIIFTPRVPPQDTIELIRCAQKTNTLILGPGSHGIIIPQKVCLGNLQPQFYQPGTVGLITSSRHFGYEVAAELNAAKLGQSMIVSVGNDRIIGSDLAYWLAALNQDSNTKAIVAIGQRVNQINSIIAYSKDRGYDKPIVVYFAGLKAPQTKVYRDALTIISNQLSASVPVVNRDRQTAAQLRKIGLKIAKKPSEIPPIIQKALARESS
ncbi:MAG: CoA-binding protein [Pleurocapsa minor HA4230-MV1]|jgi:succinyl-CoA synthetase alpha subunit|nr:CoA-binding protein [Pleurocapsa minor HA4230-MV1]